MVINRDKKTFRSCRKKFQNLLRRLPTLTFLIRLQVLRQPLGGELPYVQILKNDVPNPLTWDAQLLTYWLSRNSAVFQDYLMMWSLNTGMVTVLGRPERGVKQVEKSRCLIWASQILTVAYDGAYSPNVSIRMTRISFAVLPCRKKNSWWLLASRCCRNRACRLTCFLSAPVKRKD